MEFRRAVDIGLMRPLRRWPFQGLWYIPLWVAPGQVFAQLSDYAEAVGFGAWGKVPEALLIGICDLTGNVGAVPFLLEQKSVEVNQQEGLTFIISA